MRIEMEILTPSIKRKIETDVLSTWQNADAEALNHIPRLVDLLYANIPEKKRISYGRVFCVITLSQYLFARLGEDQSFQMARRLFQNPGDYRSHGVALGLFANCKYEWVENYFQKTADAEDWDTREMSQMFFRKLIKSNPEKAHVFLENLSRSQNANERRFVSETLRPVKENKWFYKNPDYPLSILKNLYRESSAYPRTSVGNNLSDLSRKLPGLVLSIAEELVRTDDKNAYWIAYRACRNLVKIDPDKVMQILRVDEYKYKNRYYKRHD